MLKDFFDIPIDNNDFLVIFEMFFITSKIQTNMNKFFLPPPLSIFIVVIFLLFSCHKSEIEITDVKEPSPIYSLSEASNENDITWLIDFQSYLADIHEGNIPQTNPYTAEDAALGIEWLMNIRYAESSPGFTVYGDSVVVSLNSENDWYELYTKARDHILLELNEIDSTELKLAAFQLEPIEENGILNGFESKVIFTKNTQCIVENYIVSDEDGCDVFGSDESYYLGLDGIGNKQDVLFPMDCDNSCGGTAPCGTPESFAMEEIQKHLNANYPDPDSDAFCGEGYEWSGSYSDIYTSWENYRFDDQRFDDLCYDAYDGQATWEILACSCLKSDYLNCLYCAIYNGAIDPQHPIGFLAPPDGYHVVSFDIGVEWQANNTPTLSDNPVVMAIEVTYGKPVCVEVGGVADPYPTYLEPVLMDLTLYN